MAVLTAQQRIDGCGKFIRDTDTGNLANLTKNDVRAAYNALDQYIHDNATAINNTIPQPARANLTTAQKALILRHVIAERYLQNI